MSFLIGIALVSAYFGWRQYRKTGSAEAGIDEAVSNVAWSIGCLAALFVAAIIAVAILSSR